MGQSSIGALGVPTPFGPVVFVDELLEFIEFSWSDVLERDPEGVLTDPLHARVFDRDRFLGTSRGGKDVSLFVDVNETERDLDQMMKDMRQKARTK